jgi:alpha-ketoglutarate-dependent taurine dioxygenase
MMISTRELVARLSAMDFGRSDTMLRADVDLDPALFLELLRETRLRIVPTSEGPVSVVSERGDPRDFSRQSGSFDLHTDGLYHEKIPQLVILWCENHGTGSARTTFADTRLALAQLEDEIPVLRKLESVYIGKTGGEFSNAVVQTHPWTGEETVSLGSRAFLKPRYDPASIADVPPLRSVVDAAQRLFAALDRSVVHAQRWHEGGFVLFDNYRFVHGRVAQQPDLARRLLRIWLTLDP